MGNLVSEEIQKKINPKPQKNKGEDSPKQKKQNEPSWFVLVDQNISLGNLMSDIIEDINKNNVKI